MQKHALSICFCLLLSVWLDMILTATLINHKQSTDLQADAASLGRKKNIMINVLQV